ncbi:hypothetical protein [Glycomyces sp. MUSA5-2]|uniref:hypothetical protein n=1 Tax=Glycomyces sp. MUSA5-2 TaxID=2053002 RepID=UPI0030091E0E
MQQTENQPEVAGSWTTAAGNRLYLMARRGTGYASIWLDSRPEPARIGKVRRDGASVLGIEWGEPHRGQTIEWKAAQRHEVEQALRAWETPPTTSSV